MEIGDIGKMAFKYLGNSSLFRSSQLWQEINPLVYSALFPSKIPKDLDKRLEAKLAKTAEEATIQSEADAIANKILEDDKKAKESLAEDPLSEPIGAVDDIIIAFNDTSIDYSVFFLE